MVDDAAPPPGEPAPVHAPGGAVRCVAGIAVLMCALLPLRSADAPPGKLAWVTAMAGVAAGLLLLRVAWGQFRDVRQPPARRSVWVALHAIGAGLVAALVGEARELVGQPHLFFLLSVFGGAAFGAVLDWRAVPVWPAEATARRLRYAHIVGLNVWISWAVLEVIVRLFVAVSGQQWVAVTGPAALPPHQPIHTGYRTNALGFYDAEFPTEREPDTTYVLALGDSFAFGVVPPPENFLMLLETLWTERWGRQVEVLNCGVPGAGPEDYLQVLETLAPRLPVDAVLLTFFVGNDITEWHPHRPFPALRHNYAVTALRRFGPVLTAGVYRGTTPEAVRFTDEEYRAVVQRRLAVCAPEGGAVDTAYARAQDLMSAFFDACTERALPVAVVLAPDEFQVSDRVRAAVGGAAGDALDLNRPQRRVANWASGYGVGVVDLLTPLQMADRDARTYVPNNTHWNPRGNRVAAETIAGQLPTPHTFRIPEQHDAAGGAGGSEPPPAPAPSAPAR